VLRPFDYAASMTMLKLMALSGASATYHPLLGPGHIRPGQQQCIAIIIVAAAFAFLTLPVSATARPGYEVHSGGIKIVLPVQQRDNYVISVSVHEQQRVKFVVESSYSTTEYTTEGRVTGQRIEATFGTLGRIDVGFNLVSRQTDPSFKARCRGRAPLYREGSYRGAIELAHWEGVPKVSTARGRVYFTRYFRKVCKKREHSQAEAIGKSKLRRKIEAGLLMARGKGEGRTVILGALNFAFRKNPVRSGGQLAVEIYERHEGVLITRTANTSIDHNSFAMTGPGEVPEVIEVELAAPFAGRALYSRIPGLSPSWTGDLSINLPGADRVPLTGPGFSAFLCRSSVAKVDYCLSHSPPLEPKFHSPRA
jgi:hypothetical protein